MFFCGVFPYLYYTILLLLLFSSRRVGWLLVVAIGLSFIIIFNILLYNIHYLKRKRKLNAPVISNAYLLSAIHI
jgi:hypothetical protein